MNRIETSFCTVCDETCDNPTRCEECAALIDSKLHAKAEHQVELGRPTSMKPECLNSGVDEEDHRSLLQVSQKCFTKKVYETC